MSNLSTREVLENMFNGTTAIKNQNPRFGQKEYYYINPYLDKQSSPTEKDIAYVDSPDDPNPFLQQPGSTSGTVNTTGLSGSSSLNTTSSLTNDTSSTDGIGSLNNSSATNNAFTNQSTTGLFSTNTGNSYLGTSTNNPFGTSSMFGVTNNNPFKMSSSLSLSSITGLSADNAYSNTTNEPSWLAGYNKYASKPNNASVQNTDNNQHRRSFLDSVSSSLKHDFDDTMYGAKRALSGMTFGASDLILRNANINDDAYMAERKAEGLDTLTQNAGNLANYGGSLIAGKWGLNLAKKVTPNWQYFFKNLANDFAQTGEVEPFRQNINVEYGDILPSLNYLNAPNPAKPTDPYNLYDEMMFRKNQAEKAAQEMGQQGKLLVQKYGSGGAKDIDNYSHAKLQCNFAKESPFVRNLGLVMGVGKKVFDLKEKLFDKQNHPLPAYEYIKDSVKDLKNNLYGSQMGYYNQDKPCEELLEHMRTDNMRRANIK